MSEPRKPRPFISNQDQSVRLFKSDFLESLTKVHPVTPPLIFVPWITYLLYISIYKYGVSSLSVLGLFLSGLLFWTFFEYALHRYIFHLAPIGPVTERLHFLFHGIHHDYPRDSRRLVMPPTVSIPLATLIYFGVGHFMVERFVPGFFGGFIFGYLGYDMVHFAIHHARFNSRLWFAIKNHHLRHHYQDRERSFGVSSPLWDFIFRSHEASESHTEESNPTSV